MKKPDASRRTFLKASALGAAACLTAPMLSCDKAKKKPPNLIFILADDLGYADLGCYGQKNIQTPEIDRMADEGMRFTQFYAGSTVCAPSRCSLLTGLHTGHARIKGNDDVLLEAGDETIAKMLKRAGYATGCIGKWGVGHPPPPGDPKANGFDHFFGYLSMWHAHNFYPEFLWRNEEKVPLRNRVQRPETFYRPDQIDLVGWATEAVDYAHDLFTEEALNFIRNHHKNPFFLYLPYNIPHANNEMEHRFPSMGMEVPDLGIYADKPWTEDRKGHAAMVSRMDADVGRILALLKDLRIDDETFVIFTSDNGPHPDCKGKVPCHHGNGPFRGRKQHLYEGGIRIPFIARWPGNILPGTESDHVAAFWDILPTYADLAEETLTQPTNGLSILPTLFRSGEQPTHEYLYWQYKDMKAIRFGNWKAVYFETQDKLELYDLDMDIGEQQDLADAHPLIVEKMTEMMKEACQV